MKLSCRTCTAEWSGLGRCHCSKCHNTFNSLAAFDMHLPFCADGKAISMPVNAEGYYITKEYEQGVYGEHGRQK